MKPQLQVVNTTPGQIDPTVLLMTDGTGKVTKVNPDEVMAEMTVRATYIGSVLEAILHEPHGEPRWGLNE